jgi:hypothetical protein
MVTFHIKLDYLESVEIVLSALRECSNPDAQTIAEGIERTIIRVEDGIATLWGIELPPTLQETIHANTPEPLTTSPNPSLASPVTSNVLSENPPLCKESTHLSSKCTHSEKPKHYPPLRAIQGGKHDDTGKS